MPLRIMKSGTRFKKTIEGTTFELERITPEEEQRLRTQHTVRGVFQFRLFAIAVCERGVKSWDAIEVEGDRIGYDAGLIRHFPDQVLGELMEAIRDGVDPTSPASPPISKS